MRYIIEEYRSPKEQPVIVRPEINLAKWPQLFATRNTQGRSRRIKRGDSEVVIGLQIDNKGREIEVGFLIVPDYVVLLALIHVWELHDRPRNEKVTVVVRSFVRQVLRKEPSKVKYENLELSLKRLKHVPIRWIKAFFDSKTGNLETITNEEFNFLQYLKTTKIAYDETNKKPQFKAFTFKFNDHFLQNLLSASTKPIILSEVVKLSGELPVLAYSFLDIIMARKTHWSRRAMAFIRDDLQVEADRYRKPSNCKEELTKVLKELQGKRLSTGIITQAYLRRTHDEKDYKLIIHKEPFAQQLALVGVRDVAAQPDANPEPEVTVLVQQIMSVVGHRAHNERFYHLIAQRCPRDLINTALKDTIAEAQAGNIMTSKAQFFGWWIQQLCQARAIDLGLKSSFTEAPRKS